MMQKKKPQTLPLTLLLSLWLVSSTAVAQQPWQDVLTAYLLDPGGKFMQSLTASIKAMVPLDMEKQTEANRNKMGNITLEQVASSDSAGGQVDYYLITRTVKGNIRASLQADERYQLVVFKNSSARYRNETISLAEPGKGWFVQRYSVKVRETAEARILAEGVLGTANLQNAQSDNPHQFMELLGGVARQADFIQLLDQPNIIKLVDSSDSELAMPLMEKYSKSYREYLHQETPSLRLAIKQLAELASALEHMHDRKVAHGDIHPGKLLVNGHHVVFANFERSSRLDQPYDHPRLGRKKFTYSNNAHHAPEIRFPTTPETRREWQYVPATLAGDIWSFGFTMAVVLYHLPQAHRYALQSPLNKPLLSLYPLEENSYSFPLVGLSRGVLDSPLSTYMRNIRVEEGGDPISDVNKDTLKALLDLIEQCTSYYPDRRPDAGTVAKKLQELSRQ
ncbi:MAG: protein kinase domain-containing protein [Endozoicomonas sp.]